MSSGRISFFFNMLFVVFPDSYLKQLAFHFSILSEFLQSLFLFFSVLFFLDEKSTKNNL